MSADPAAAATAVQFELLPRLYYPEWGFRPGVPMYKQPVNFVFLNGGFGDYLCWLTPIRWLATEATWIKGGLVIPKYFREIVDYFMRDFPEWTLHEYKDIKDAPKFDSVPFRGPLQLANESLNATGAHLMTCGWVYFTNKEKAPPGWENYVQFRQADLDAVALPEAAKPLVPGRYAVMTTGITTPSRAVPDGAWAPVIEHVIARGLTPVFLGKSVVETGNQRNIHTRWSDGTDYTVGVDLRNQTTLMQAAAIMSRAAVVVGHDNGLLHLAGCTTVPIVFGYNIASPEHRRPIRPAGQTYDVTLTRAELSCIHCQSKTNFLLGFNFQKCLYGDTKCLHIMFSDGAVRWKTAIDQALEERCP